jgi:hypothetical protein
MAQSDRLEAPGGVEKRISRIDWARSISKSAFGSTEPHYEPVEDALGTGWTS